MKRAVVGLVMILLLLPASSRGGESGGEEALGTLEHVVGDVQIGQGGQWSAATPGDELRKGMMLKTGEASSVEVLFAGEVSASVGAGATIEASDLLLKTRLERMRNKVSEPTDTRKVEMKVTPTTGVRGTEQTEEKAEDLKRDHYWNEAEK